MFDKLLIADRGEIALRIARTCERLGITSVAVHSEIERDAMHVEICDEALCIGPARAQDSYLNGAAIIEAAKQSGAQAVHPGYGLLGESPAFARAVVEAGLKLIGPQPDVLELYCDKLRCRALARHAGVRTIPGSHAAITSLDDARTTAEEIGYPLLVKPAAGKRGIGMQRVDEPEELELAIGTCRDHALAAFGDERVYLERWIDRPRQLEVQLLCDGHGDPVAVGERECSIQRRNQKLLEEAPAPVFSGLPNGELKQQILSDSAVRIAKEGGFVGIAGAEFLMDAEGSLYFVEWSPRLQVEHVVTEMCTGLDLVEQQIRIAAGERLASSVIYAQPSGHAVEARVYAEDAREDFASKAGEIKALRFPTVAPGALRIESAVTAGSAVSGEYDALLAKVVTYSPTRHQALLTLDRVLAESVIEPLTTNLGFLRTILGDESFRAGHYDTELTTRLLQDDSR